MHEAALAQAALPAPTYILGLAMQPYSIGHELWLIRQGNPLVIGGEPDRRHIYEAALICCETWAGAKAMRNDWLMGLKLRLWKWLTHKEDFALAIADFRNYRQLGCAAFPAESPQNSKASRVPGAPFLLRLIQFMMMILRMPESQIMDYPLGLAQMHYCTWLEREGALEIYNEHDATRDKWIEEMEAKGGIDKCQV